MNLSCWGGGIEDFSSCCAACVEFVRNPSKQDCNCGELCSSILLSSGLELLPGRIPSSTFWSCLDDRSFHQSHLQSPRKYFCYFFCSCSSSIGGFKPLLPDLTDNKQSDWSARIGQTKSARCSVHLPLTKQSLRAC